jgi:Fe-S oxidoreductase
MCPSYVATGDEKDSTRGRSRVLQELANGTLVGGFRADELTEALDLCLSCKGCSSDCPAGVDMATCKSERSQCAAAGRRILLPHPSSNSSRDAHGVHLVQLLADRLPVTKMAV